MIKKMKCFFYGVLLAQWLALTSIGYSQANSQLIEIANDLGQPLAEMTVEDERNPQEQIAIWFIPDKTY